MRRLLQVAAIAAAATASGSTARAQTVNNEPINQKWSPTEWGADDKIGAVNRTTPELVLKAVGLVKKGKTATLGKIYASDAPAFGSRSWKLVIPGRPTGGPFGNQQLVYNDELSRYELTDETATTPTPIEGLSDGILSPMAGKRVRVNGKFALSSGSGRLIEADTIRLLDEPAPSSTPVAS